MSSQVGSSVYHLVTRNDDYPNFRQYLAGLIIILIFEPMILKVESANTQGIDPVVIMSHIALHQNIDLQAVDNLSTCHHLEVIELILFIESDLFNDGLLWLCLFITLCMALSWFKLFTDMCTN